MKLSSKQTNWSVWNASHPVRVRGLKRYLPRLIYPGNQSHPVRVRGLKRNIEPRLLALVNCRTPCGCVG